MELRRAQVNDAEFIYTLVRDPASAPMFFTKGPANLSAHTDWLKAQLAQPDVSIFIAKVDGVDFGVFRATWHEDTFEVSVNLAPTHHGRGLGTKLIKRGIQTVTQTRPARACTALVKPKNAASLRAFEKAGFYSTGALLHQGQAAIRLQRDLLLSPSWPSLQFGGRTIGDGHPVFVVAELSANHGGRIENALRLIDAAKAAGADAVKLQTYTADSMTLSAHTSRFLIPPGSPWSGRYLHDLYQEAHTPLEWHETLFAHADQLKIPIFSTPFDLYAVDFLVKLGVPAIKIASFELVDLPLIRHAASTGKPLILSTGMSTRAEIEEALAAARGSGAREIVVLKCTSAYPADPSEMNLREISAWKALGWNAGFSDHTLGADAALVAIAAGANLIEKHISLPDMDATPDSGFSTTADDFKTFVEKIRLAQTLLGRGSSSPSSREQDMKMFRRSIFAARPITKGERFTSDNIRVVRPSSGLHPRFFEILLGKPAPRDIPFGEPLEVDDLEDPTP